MQITKVEATNLKGRTFSYELSPAVAIVGDNFTGKTSIIDAIRLALIGYIPELGKTNAATYQLASDDPMTVLLTLDNGQSIGVTAYLDKTAKVAHKIYANEPSALTEESTMNIPLLNASAYFAMTERDRYNYVFNVAKLPAEFSTESIIAECERISFEEEHTEEIEKAKADVIATLRKVKDPVQEFLRYTVELMKNTFTTWNARAKDTQGAVRVMAELKNREAAMGASARELEEEKRKAGEVCSLALGKVGELDRQKRDARAYQDRKTHAETLRRAVVTDADSEISKLETNIKEAALMLKVVAEPKTDVQALRDALMLEQARLPIKKSGLDDIDERLTILATQTYCPYCKTRGARWKDEAERELNFNKAKTDKDIKASEKTIAALKTKVQKADEELQEWREVSAKNRELNQKITLWQGQIDQINAKRAEWKASLEKVEKAVGDEVKAPSEKDLREADEALEARKRALATVTDRLRAADLLAHELKRGAQAQLEHERAKAFVRVTKAVRETLETKKEALVDRVFNDLLAVANGMVGLLLPTPLAFHEGEVGRWDGHRWISNKTFTGAEQALTFVAIAAALSQSSPIKLVIFDELGRLDERHILNLLCALFAAKDTGWIDQFIVAGAVPAPKQSKDFVKQFGKLQIIDLNQKEAA